MEIKEEHILNFKTGGIHLMMTLLQKYIHRVLIPYRLKHNFDKLHFNVRK